MEDLRNEINEANLLAIGFKRLLNDFYCIHISGTEFVQVRRKKGVWHLYECDNYRYEYIPGNGTGSLKNVCLHTYKVKELSDVANRLKKILKRKEKEYNDAISEMNQMIYRMNDYYLKNY